MKRLVAILAVLVLAALTSATLAGKGGGKPGGGGGEPPDYSVAYMNGSGVSTAYVMTADGSATKRLRSFLVNSISWHADGDKLLVATSDRNPEGIYTLDLAGGNNQRTLVLPVAVVSGTWPQMSNVPTPTGTRLIAYVTYDATGHQNLFVCNEDGTNPVALLTSYPYALMGRPTFHPSGDSIAVAVIDVGDDALQWYTILVDLGVDGGGNAIAANVTQLTGLAGTSLESLGTSGPTFSNSGDTLAVASIDDIWFVDMQNLTNVTNVTNGQVFTPRTGAWDATDQLFYFSARASSDPGGTTIHTIDTTGNITNLGVGRHKPKCRMP